MIPAGFIHGKQLTARLMLKTTAQRAGRPVIDDSELFRQFLAGSDSAFVEFYDRYDRRLRLYCTKVVGDVDIAEDLAQELWEKVIRMRVSEVEVSEPTHYLMRMARNLCIKYLQRRRQHGSLDDLHDGEHPAASSREPSHLEELVKMAVDRLPFDQREVIVLHNYVGYGYEEIASMRGESVGAVKMRAMRARSRVGRIVSAYLALDGGEDGGAPPENIIAERKR